MLEHEASVVRLAASSTASRSGAERMGVGGLGIRLARYQYGQDLRGL